jgi:hypothetical protein
MSAAASDAIQNQKWRTITPCVASAVRIESSIPLGDPGGAHERMRTAARGSRCVWAARQARMSCPVSTVHGTAMREP